MKHGKFSVNLKNNFAKQIEKKMINRKIYKGSKFKLMISSTKYGVDSYLTPIESDQQRYNKNFAIFKATNAHDKFYK